MDFFLHVRLLHDLTSSGQSTVMMLSDGSLPPFNAGFYDWKARPIGCRSKSIARPSHDCHPILTQFRVTTFPNTLATMSETHKPNDELVSDMQGTAERRRRLTPLLPWGNEQRRSRPNSRSTASVLGSIYDEYGSSRPTTSNAAASRDEIGGDAEFPDFWTELQQREKHVGRSTSFDWGESRAARPGTDEASTEQQTGLETEHENKSNVSKASRVEDDNRRISGKPESVLPGTSGATSSPQSTRSQGPYKRLAEFAEKVSFRNLRKKFEGDGGST